MPQQQFQSPSQSQTQGLSQGQSQGSLPFDPASAAEAAVHALASHALPVDAAHWDELRDAQGRLRGPWQRFAACLPPPAGGVGFAEDLDQRVAQVERRIRLDGVTHNVYGDRSDPGASSRPWSLELLPQLIEPADWARIEAGVVQRAELAQRMLADLYGPQHLLREGLLPPALLLRHPGWLRPMMGVEPPSGLRLFIVAFDLARGPQGHWWQVAQRTQGPSGLGYVLHNRLVIARQFPEAFRDLRVQHIASSYRRLLDTLEAAARDVARGATPRVVLLTPGPYSETYFEHAYLARYLGLPLVEGGDLTVRDERVFLKTVDGLEPVHGVLRRIDDDWCDPLELRTDSALGIPGLLMAARAGSVVMANALGSAFLETPAIQGFMPAIAERLLGEPLRMPSLPTWWCGEAAAFDDARAHPEEHIVRRTYPEAGSDSALRRPGDAAIADDPDAWTIQSRVRYSRAPIWGDGALSLRPSLVRVYAIADGGGRWHVLPGGMTRVARREDSSVSMQRGGTSLDTWVLTDGPVDTFSMLPQRLQVDDIAQRRRPVSSRTGENLFWLGRYTERTEQLVRLARATLLLIDADNDAPPEVLQALSALAATTGLAPVGVPSLVRSPPLFERALLAALGDAQALQGAASIAYNLAALDRTTLALRDRLSAEHWGLIRTMRESFAAAIAMPAGGLPALEQVLPALDRLALQLAAITGAQTDRMTRDHGWRLLTVGRLIERLLGVAQRLQAFVDAQALASAAGIELLLELFDSLITFRARYQRHEDLLALVDLLVLDSDNPRAYAGVLRRLRTEIGKLPGDPAGHADFLALLPEQGAGMTLESLRGADDRAIAESLRALSALLVRRASALADRIGEVYFVLAQGADRRV
ncbi:MAG: circularly permuted type 2 ATP-grasp protein [Burkholderiales bacterium]|nr:circularly permuted type 2 ATP-grasp protein [Burkholderiales bacterium]